MTELRLALLGPPVVLRDGSPVTFDTRKAIALLALLAVTGREHSREQLADLLWPEADSVRGRASLRRTLSVTAAAMGAGQASIEHQLADVHHRLGDWDLAEAHLALVTELVTGAEPVDVGDAPRPEIWTLVEW
jgi:hypothetical protein